MWFWGTRPGDCEHARSWGLGVMKALQATCVVGAVGAIILAGMIHQLGGRTPDAVVPDATPASAASAETPAAPALPPAAAEAPAPPTRSLGFKLASAGEVAGLSLMAKADIGDESIATKTLDLGHHD